MMTEIEKLMCKAYGTQRVKDILYDFEVIEEAFDLCGCEDQATIVRGCAELFKQIINENIDDVLAEMRKIQCEYYETQSVGGSENAIF